MISEKRKHHLIEMLFKMNGIKEELSDQAGATLHMFINKYADLSPEFFHNLDKEFGIDFLMDKMEEHYDKHFSVEDIQSFIDFWSSSAGKKLRGKVFVEEQRSLGRGWATLLDERCQLELKTTSKD